MSLYILRAVANVLVPVLVQGLPQPLQPRSPSSSLGNSRGATCSPWHMFPWGAAFPERRHPGGAATPDICCPFPKGAERGKPFLKIAKLVED